MRRKVARIYLADSKSVGRNVAHERRGMCDSSKNLKERSDLDHWYQVVILTVSYKAEKKNMEKQDNQLAL